MTTVHTQIRPIGASVRWNLRRCGSLGAAVNEIQAAGFEYIELCGLDRNGAVAATIHGLPGRLPAISIHSPCPDGGSIRDTRIPGDWLADEDSDKRKLAVYWAQESVRFAESMGTRYLVLHLGATPIGGREQRLSGILRARGRSSAAYQSAIDEYTLDRARYAPAARERACASLETILGVGTGEVTVCIENRYSYAQLMTYSDVNWLTHTFSGANVATWFDSGHDYVQRWLGLVNADERMALLASAVGAHLHDALAISDHRSPGNGDVEFEEVIKFLPSRAPLILELDPDVTVQDARSGLARIGSCI